MINHTPIGQEILTNYNTHKVKSRIDMLNEFLSKSGIEPIVDTSVETTESYTNPVVKSKKQNTKNILGKKIENFDEVIKKTGAVLTYIKSGSTGQTFKGVITFNNNEQFIYALKVCAFPKCEKYGDYDDAKRPENAEIRMLKALSYFVITGKTPHLMLPYCTFDTDIKYFISDNDTVKIADSKLYKDFIENEKKGKFHKYVSVLMCEWANSGDFLDFIRKNYETITPMMWKIFFFQIISALAIIQHKYPTFRHNDLKANNILVQKILSKSEKKKKLTTEESAMIAEKLCNKLNNGNGDETNIKMTPRVKTKLNYTIAGTTYNIPKLRYQLKIWDFDFSCIPGIIDNKKVGNGWTKSLNITNDKNRYYDIHFFFITLVTFFEKQKTKVFPPEVLSFVDSILPDRLVNGTFIDNIGMLKTKDANGKITGTTKGKSINVCYNGKRLMKNEEFITPDDILKTNPYFGEFRSTVTRDYYTNMNIASPRVKNKTIKTSDNKSKITIKRHKYKL